MRCGSTFSRAEEFERYHELQLRNMRDALDAIDAGTYHSAGGAMNYLVAATKP